MSVIVLVGQACDPLEVHRTSRFLVALGLFRVWKVSLPEILKMGKPLIPKPSCAFPPERANPGIHMLTLESIMSCEKSHQRTLFNYIVLTGGTSACTGLRFRMQKEMAKVVSPEFCVKVLAQTSLEAFRG